MNKVMRFIQKERLYILLLVFVILVNVVASMPVKERVKGSAFAKASADRHGARAGALRCGLKI